MAQDIHIRVSAVWKRVKNVSVKVSGAWKDVLRVYVKVSGVWEQVYLRQREITISSNTDNYNVFSAFGSPSNPAIFILTINSGVIVGSTTTAMAALRSGSLPSGSTLKIINDGQIIAKGGDGGDGGDIDVGATGLIGGDAIDLTLNTTIDNTNGNIFGGGGGGGGGGFADFVYAGGGGGGGAGDNGGAGGSCYNVCAGVACQAGSPGTTVGGVGGQGAECSQGDPTNFSGGDGGNGGEYGAAGNSGTYGSSGSPGSGGAGGSGGSAGKAIDLNGSSITWLGGNNGTQVKGVVS